MKEKFYITTPIYYPSANFHIGHCYTTIIADAIARFKRLEGYDVFFQTGTDDHGQKIENKAKETEKAPKDYVDEIVENAKDLWKTLKISYDYFIRTTDDNHIKAVQQIFETLYKQGDIYKGEYKGLYCTPCESFWTESQLVDGKCPDCEREVKEVSEEAYFFKLSKYQKQLTEYIESHPDFIQPVSRKNEMINNFIKPGLADLCVSRSSFTWGIPVSFDEKHVIYVWIDALSNYITSLGYTSDDSTLFDKFWPADLHLVGKEIVRFHTIIWPAILMALDLPLPKQIFGHGWLIIDGGKISKSLGNYQDPREYVRTYGVDAVRYFALKEVPFGNDGNFSEEALISRTNSDLVNNLGNLVTRTVSMTNKYLDDKAIRLDNDGEVDNNLISEIKKLQYSVKVKMNEYKVNEALTEIMDLLKKCNKYIDDTTPWIVAKDPKKKDYLNTILYNILEGIRISAILLQAFIPDTSEKIFNILATDKRSFDDLEFGQVEEYLVKEAQIIYERIENK
jgi:methionyl-tRNA synthetase